MPKNAFSRALPADREKKLCRIKHLMANTLNHMFYFKACKSMLKRILCAKFEHLIALSGKFMIMPNNVEEKKKSFFLSNGLRIYVGVIVLLRNCC